MLFLITINDLLGATLLHVLGGQWHGRATRLSEFGGEVWVDLGDGAYGYHVHRSAVHSLWYADGRVLTGLRLDHEGPCTFVNHQCLGCGKLDIGIIEKPLDDPR